MELVLTGRRFDAKEALGDGHGQPGDEEGRLAGRGAGARGGRRPPPPLAARLAKEAILTAEETGLTAGVEAERRLFGVAMATEDRVEAMEAFLEKRKPDFHGR